MVEPNSQQELEKKVSLVDSWIARISGEGVVGEDVTSEILSSVLGHYGADFEPRPELETLAGYSNLKKRQGLDAVWGMDRVDAYKKWILEVCVPKYEQKWGKALPTLYDRKADTYDDVKHSGMMQFLGELTAYAAGKQSLEDYKRHTENRVKKGKNWQEGTYEPSPNAPFLPEFPVDAWSFIKSGFTSTQP